MATIRLFLAPAWQRYVARFVLWVAYACASLVLLAMLLVAIGCVGMLWCTRQDRAMLDLRNIRGALKLDRHRRGHYPTTADGLRGLVHRQMLDAIPRDPWNNEYGYLLWGGCPVIWSYGADGAPGGEGQDADLSNMGAAPPPWILERAAQAPPLPPPASCPGAMEPDLRSDV